MLAHVTARDSAGFYTSSTERFATNTYLQQSAHAEVTDVDSFPFRYDSVRRGGARPPAVPSLQGFWEASAWGHGTQALTWKPEGGRWAVVVMNADGSRTVTADVSLGAKADAVLPIGIALLAVGLLGLVAAAGLIWLAARETRGRR